MKKRSWRQWMYENVYLPLCFALTTVGLIAVGLGYLSFWAVAGSSLVIWVLNLMVWGLKSTENSVK